jgi:hypothetical protein
LKRSIYVGWEMREAAAYAVTRSSVQRHLSAPIPVHGLVLEDLQARGLYTRPMKRFTGGQDDRLIDVISDAPCATEFAVSRFLVPHLAQEGWALFLDCDFLIRADLAALFDGLDPKFAAYCVKHDYQPRPGIKMDGQLQTAYPRKLWSSFCIWNASHPANEALTLEMVNGAPGRDLHAMGWLRDEDIGDLGQEWNWVPGHSPADIEPKAVHFTEGGAWLRAYEHVAYADEWKAECLRWAA